MAGGPGAAPRRYAAAVLLVAALTVAGCGGADPATTSSPTGSPNPSSTASTPPPTSVDPAVLDAGRELLDWSSVPGPVADTVTRSSAASLSVDEAATSARLESATSSRTIRATSRQQVSDALLDDAWAVVVLQDRREERASSATVVDLATGRDFVIDGSSDVPTVNGGTWALGDGHLLHATTEGGAYCVASVDLASRSAQRGWCAPERSGFNTARITPAGDSLLTFDDSQPSCRTAVRLTGTTVEPLEGVAKCAGWESLVLDDGAVWSVIPREKKVEEAHVHARTGASRLDLGPATSGTLTWCADAAYFVRDPQRDGDDAALMRWSPDDGLDVVYESPGGQAFLSAPRCGADTLTLTAFARSGDEQVSAPLT